MRIQELEATLYNALQQETVIKFGELLSEKQQEELRTAAADAEEEQSVRLSDSPGKDGAHQRICDLEDKQTSRKDR